MIVRPSIVWVLLLLPGLSAGAMPSSEKGVIVETVTPNFVGEKAGVRSGDVILRWSRGDAHGEIESPFDFFQLEVEQKPRGPVLLEGLRGTAKQTWTLGPDNWGLRIRPELPDDLLFVYHRCQSLREGQSTEGCKPDAATGSPLWLGSWFALQVAEALSDARQWPQAEKAYELAVQHSKEAGPAVAGCLLNKWAVAYEARGDLQNAEKRYQDSLLEHQRYEAESLALASDLNGLGSVTRKRGDLAKAEEYSRRALAIAEKLAPESLEVAVSVNNLGNIAWAHRDLPTAEQYHRRALDIRQKLAPGSLAVAGSLNNLGLIAWQRDQLDKAQDYQLQALEIRKKLASGSMDLAASFNNLGGIALDRGDLAKAENYYRQALAIREALAPESLDLGTNLNNLGLVAWRRGELQGAEQYYRRSLLIQQNRGVDTLEVADTFHNLADVLWEEGDGTAAEQSERKALAIRQKLAPRSLDVAASLNNLGFSALERGDYIPAESYVRQALEIERTSAPEHLLTAQSLHELGELAQVRNDFTGAARFYREELWILEKLSPGSKSQAESLAALARAMLRAGKLEDATTLFEKALLALESQTARMGGTEEAHYVFRATHADYYAEYIDLLFKQRQYALAFQVAERSRAQSFLEMLSAARVNVDQSIDPALLARKRHLVQAISSKSSDRIELFNSKHTPEQETALNQEIEKLLNEYQQLEDQIRSGDPGYAELTQPRSLTVKQVQDELLDAETLVLEYSLGAERSYLWMISQTSLYAYELPSRRIIEDTARQVHRLLIAPPPQSPTELDQQHAKWNLTAARLSRMVLGPVASQLSGKRLLIVTDGALQYIPFEVLPLPAIAASRVRAAPLVVKHEIVYLPSASVLDILRKVGGTQKAGRTLAVLADPVFDKDDARVRLVPVKQPSGAAQSQVTGDDPASSAELLTRSAADSGIGPLSRLSYSRREADAILATIPAGQGVEFLDFQASKVTATSPDLAQFRMIHFATHGLLDSRHPELSGLVLTLVDQEGNPINGFLSLQDIYNLHLHADLVVLSACETALGKEVRGEGLIGLTRGFLYAGASRVLASLWKVDDVATAELMARFYKSMEQIGMRPAAALRQAQIETWRQKRWSMPYYWAGFQLQGEWR